MATAGRRLRRLDYGEEVDLVDHLDELRKRLFVSLAALAVGFAVAFWRHGDIIRLLNDQLPTVDGKPVVPIVLAVGEQFMLAVMVSFYAALILALPVLFYQLYAFVIPAFSKDTAKVLWPIMLFVPALFVAGVVFAYEVVLPASVSFLLNFDSDLYNTQVRAKDYYGFACMVMAAMGIIFEMPAAVLVLTRLRILSSRIMRRNRKYAVVLCAIVAAALPSVDPLTMLLELAPLLVLYEISIWIAVLVEGRNARADARFAAEYPDDDDEEELPSSPRSGVTYR
jgi:sec-independent protein translocase protein TatC